MIWLSSPKHSHTFTLEKEAYAECPKANTPWPVVMWGQIEGCQCGAKRFSNPELLKRGGQYAELA